MPDKAGNVLRRLAIHQRNAVVRVEKILSNRWGAILADEPGLGKTYVAAAVAARMQTAERIRIEVVLPASLRAHWKRVLDEFDVDATISTHTSFARCDARTETADSDFLIVDEAHRFRNPATRRYGTLSARSVNRRVLFVTATPVCNSPLDLLTLVQLIAADDELEVSGVPSIEECFVSRSAGVETVFRKFCVRHLVDESDIRVESFNQRTVSYSPLTNREAVEGGIQELTFPWTAGRVSRRLLRLFLRHRLESSVAALRASLIRMLRVCGRAAELAKRGKSLTASELRRVFGDPDAGAYQDILFPGFWGATERVGGVDVLGFEEEARRLKELAGELAEDPKVELLRSEIQLSRGVPGLVFTGSYDTASSLYASLSGTLRCALLSGRRCLVEERRTDVRGVVDEMSRNRLDLIVATDLGAEGLNLQTAGFVVHYDLPWNPAIVEQRNGRILRLGQKRLRLEAIYMIPEGSRVLPVLSAKRRTNAALLEARGRGSEREGSDGGWCLPPRLEKWRPQVALLARLRTQNRASDEISNLLSVGYRAGVERWLTRMLHTRIDGDDLERLIRILRTENQIGARHGRSHIILS